MNKSQIAAILSDVVSLNNGKEHGSYLPDQLSEVLYTWTGQPKVVQPDGFTVAKEDSYGGEGEGERYWAVYSITNNATGEKAYAKFDGYYQSYDGHEWSDGDDFTVVVAKEVPKIEWVSEGE